MMASQTQYESSHSFYPQVEGLRAVAVVAVLLFHFSPTYFPGGFIGVDLFMVISGFVIGNSIFQSISRGHGFSYRIFIRRRLRRLYPALIIFLTIMTPLQLLLAGPNTFRTRAQDALAAFSYSSNWVLINRGTSYFDLFAD
jgi:peptidoglycan/LPS O-acetylase OafA/YrhL